MVIGISVGCIAGPNVISNVGDGFPHKVILKCIREAIETRFIGNFWGKFIPNLGACKKYKLFERFESGKRI